MNFADRLTQAIVKKQTPLCVGLDPRVNRLPTSLRPDSKSSVELAAAFEKFCREVIDAVEGLVPAVKPQAAFFEMLGPDGSRALFNVVRYAQEKNLLVIMDAKRGDIGSTAEAYASAFLGESPFGGWASDCLTVNPYLGDDSLTPFVTRCRETATGIFVLVRTSNPGGKMLQELESEGKKIYSIVGKHVQNLASEDIGQYGYGSVGAVIGATNPAQLVELRNEMPNAIFLVPGIGAQGATAKDIAGAFDDNGYGACINSSRAIIFAYENPEFTDSADANNWQAAVEKSARKTIAEIAAETTAGKLLA